MAGTRLLGRFTAAGVGNLGYAGCTLAMTIVIARSGPQEMLGAYALAHSIAAPLFFLFGLSLINVIATDVSDEFSPAEYFVTTLAGAIPAFTIVMLLSIVLSPGSGSFVAATALIALAYAIDGLSHIGIGYLRSAGHLDDIAAALLCNGLASLSLVAIGAAVYHSLTLAALGYAAGSCVGLVVTTRLWHKRMNGGVTVRAMMRVGGRRVRQVVARAYPLGLSGTLSLASAHIPRLALGHTTGISAVGLYAAAAQPMLAAGLLVTSMSECVIGEMSHRFKSADFRRMKALVSNLIVFATAVSGLGVAAILLYSDRILAFLYGSSYAAASTPFVVLGIAVGVRTVSAVLGTTLSAMRRFDLNMWFKVPGALAIALSSVPLASRYGVSGAAFSVLLGALIEATTAGLLLWRLSLACPREALPVPLPHVPHAHDPQSTAGVTDCASPAHF